MSKILIIEDEEKLRNELKDFLSHNGYEVEIITNFDNVIDSTLNLNVDLILLDINLPIVSGEYICKELRKSISTPIIIVTSRNTEMDELISINYGADDFITKPYNSQILLARINRLINRNNFEDIISFNNIKINVSSSLLIRNDNKIDLSRNELKILVYLVKNKNKIVSRDELMDYLWEMDEFIDDNTLTVNINRLRSKLEIVGLKDKLVTKRSQGYILYENN